MLRFLRPVAAGALLCALALGATGCGGDDDKTPAADPSSTPSLSPSVEPTVEISNDLGGPLTPVSGLPSDFPSADVPLVPGEVTQPVGPGSAEQGWVLEVAVAKDRDDCYAAAAAALVLDGFRLSAGPNRSKENIEALFVSRAYNVIATATTDGTGCKVSYEVAPAGPQPSP